MPIGKIAGYELHPLAAKLPLMDEADFAKFAEDIKKNGLLDPIVLYAGKVLDGRHRLMACEKVGVQPRFAQWDSLTAHTETTPFEYVISKNFHRRQLSQSQKAIIALDVLSEFEQDAAHRQKEALRKGGAPVSAPVRERDELGKASEQAAKAAGVSARSMESAKAVAKASPELAEKVRAGEISLKKAEKQIRREGQVRAAKVYVPPTGEFSVIVTDFPWKYDDALDGSDAVRGGCPYPPMTLDEIKAFPIPAAKDCVQFMNITHQHFLQGAHLPVLAAQGFTAKNWFTWKKNRIGTGHLLRNITEHVIIAVRGNPTLVPLTDQPTFFEADVGEHSEKPDELYALIEKMAPAPAEARLEMFARVPSREGWTITGSEKGVLDQKPPRKPCPGWRPGPLPEICGACRRVHESPANTGAAGQSSVPLSEVLRECKVRGFTVELPAQEYDSHVARCDGCSTSVEFEPDQADKVEASVLEELREHTCSTLDRALKTATDKNCAVCGAPFVDATNPAQLSIDGTATHERCVGKTPLAELPLLSDPPKDTVDAEIREHPANAAPCRSCGATAGEPCLTGSKRPRFPHEPRLRDAAKVQCIGFPRGGCAARVNAQPTGQNICRKCAIAETNAAKKAKKEAADAAVPSAALSEFRRDSKTHGFEISSGVSKKGDVLIARCRGCGETVLTSLTALGDVPLSALNQVRDHTCLAESSSARAGLCEKQGRAAVKRCLLKDGHRGKCKLNDLKNRAAK